MVIYLNRSIGILFGDYYILNCYLNGYLNGSYWYLNWYLNMIIQYQYG